MNLQKISALIKMELKKLIREPAFLFMLILFPAVLTFTFGMTFTNTPILTLGMSFPNMLTLVLGINLPSMEILPNIMLTLTLGINLPDGAITVTYGLNLPNSILNPGAGSEMGMDFNAMVPGLFAFACIFMIMTVSMSFSTDRKEGLLKRLNTTPMTSGEFMGSNVISKMLIAILQVFLIFGIAVLIGFKPLTDIIGILIAFGIMAIFSLSTVGLGLITATISKNPEVAVGISFVFILPQMFLGTFIPLNDTTRIIAMALPSYYTTDALKLIFKGKMFTSPNFLLDLSFISIVSIVIVIIGIQLFKKYGNI